MKNLELAMKLLNSMEGLEVSLKLGTSKDSQLIITGDFIKITEAFAKLTAKDAETSRIENEIYKLQQKLD